MTARARSAGAAAGLAAVLAGVPILLYTLGGGLPTSLPDGRQIHRFFTHPITDAAILRGVSLVCWLLWALFALAVIAELAAYLRRRPSPSDTHVGFRIPGLQGAAGALFLTAILLIPQRPSPAATPATFGRLPLATTYLTATTTAPTSQAQAPAQSIAADLAGRGWHTYTVQRYDTPWGIAETHLGNGMRWREILDTNGHTLATGTSSWVERSGHWEDDPQARLIFPGQELLLPADAVGLAQPVADPTSHPSAGTQPSAPAPAPPAGQSAATATPPATTPAPVTETPTTIPDRQLPSDGTTARPESTVAATTPRESISSERPAQIIEVSAAILAAGIVAAAALETLGRLRIRQSRAKPAGRRIRLPHPELARTELAIRVASRDDLVAIAHRAVHTLTGDLQHNGATPQGICGLLVNAESVEVLLERPSPLPGGWEATGDGFRWRTAPQHLAEIPDGAAEPYPTLVPLGRIPGTTTEVLVNLAAAGLIEVLGPDPITAGIIHAAAVALTGLPWASASEVILVGFGQELAATAAHVRFVPALDDITEDIEAALTASDRIDLSDLGAAGEQWDRREQSPPTVILCAEPPPPAQLDWLQGVCQPVTGITALVASETPHGAWTIQANDQGAFVPQLRVAIEAISLPADDFDAISRLVEVALDETGAVIDEPPYNQLDCSYEHDAPPASVQAVLDLTAGQAPTSRQTVPAVTVKVLGPVEFEGAGEFRRPRSAEIALYLAVHPRGVSGTQLDESIWPTRMNVPSTTRDSAISAVRSALGGPSRFPHAHQGPDKRYQLSDLVGTDWQRFCELHRSGRRAADPAQLREALELVRGRPFGDLDSGPGYEWLHLEGHVHHMEAEIADAADLAARLFLEAGQPIDARWAASQGLLAAPYTERLWTHLMAAADALGEAQEVERILGEMDRRLGLDGDFEQLHPDTVAAYRRHSRRQRRAAR